MDDFLNILIQYGPYLGLAVIVAGVVQSLKLAFKKFFTQSTLGMRLMPFLPILLGMIGGFFLPQETIASKLMVGGALGTMSSLIYGVITRTFGSTAALQQKIDLKQAAKTANDSCLASSVPTPTEPGPGDEVK
jgi:hypothetical protein